MTLKYESELLFDLMKRDGDDAPSDVLPYESELKEKYLNQVTGAYPKLQDYRAEWLNYNLYHHLPSDFPVETVSNVTSASFNNVVPYAYKSAILKGVTYNNVCINSNLIKKVGRSTSTQAQYNLTMIDTSKNYDIYFDVTDSVNNNVDINITVQNWSVGLGVKNTNGRKKVTINGSQIANDFEGIAFYFLTQNYDNGARANVSNVVIVESNNYNLPYFTGMQSVKMPVLTTSNEDGTKTIILTVNEPVELRGIGDVKDTLDLTTGELTQRIGKMIVDDSNDWWIAPNADGSLRTGKIFSEIKFYSKLSCDLLPTIVFNDVGGQKGVAIYEQQIIIYTEHTNEEELKRWVQQNPLTIQYELATESIKTVDLSCNNEQGESETFRPIEGTMHVSTSSQTLPPLLDMSVPIEATSQNLMSFANIVEEE